MSADDYTEVLEVAPDVYIVNWGMSNGKGHLIGSNLTLRDAIKLAKEQDAEYGPYIAFLEDNIVHEGTG